jgi:6-phosphogluconolactonase (cycloisomerase 2 family)
MRNLPAALGALAIVLFWCRSSGVTAPVASDAPFVLIVPYSTIAAGVRSSNSVSVYKIDASNGAPKLVAGSPFEAGQSPGAEALAPGGRFAYVVNEGSHDVSAYKINATTGALTPVAGSPFKLDGVAVPAGITIDAADKYAYVASNQGVFAFAIEATSGALAPVPGSPFAAGGPIELDPTDRFAYVLDTFNNKVSTYTIDPTGALKRAGSPVHANINGNDPSPVDSEVDPRGRFLYVHTGCCVNIYAIGAQTGTLAPPAHVRLGLFDNLGEARFAIDPTGKFAYAADGSRIYAYTIDAATGAVKAVEGGGAAVRAGTDTDGVTIDPTGRFAYVSDPGFHTGSHDTTPMLFAYRIDPSTGGLTPLRGSPFAVATNNVDAIARWFDAGRCTEFDRGWTDGPLVGKRDSEGVIFDPITADTRGYFYDPESRSALYYPQRDSEGTFTLRVSGQPPAGVPRHDLSKLRTISGIALGSTSAMVVRLLGKPEIVSGCGLLRYIYLRSPVGEPSSLQFTIDRGRVTEIFEDFPG